MFIAWSGRGFTTILFLFLALLICIFVLPASYMDYSFVIAFYIAGFLSYVFGIRWNSKISGTYIDSNTGQEVQFKNKHSLFWIKMEIWGVIFIVLGLLALVLGPGNEGAKLYLNIFAGLTGIGILIFLRTALFKKVMLRGEK